MSICGGPKNVGALCGRTLRTLLNPLLPAITTSVVQPCDCGILMNLKTLYRNIVMSYILDQVEEGYLNVFTFQGYSGFAPIIFYFDHVLSFDISYRGFYTMVGFGLVGLFKSDWEKLGGMNTTMFKEKWGFEDNDLANRLLENGYHIFRLPTRDFYHQDHSTAQLWS